MNRKVLIFLGLLVFCFSGQAIAEPWIQPAGALTFAGYITQDGEHPNVFYGFSTTADSGGVHYLKTEMLYHDNEFGITSSIINSGDSYNALLNKSQDAMTTSFVKLHSSPQIILDQRQLYGPYTVLVTLVRTHLPEFYSKVQVSYGKLKYTKDFSFGFVNAIYPFVFESKKYFALSIISCSASTCGTELRVYELE